MIVKKQKKPTAFLTNMPDHAKKTYDLVYNDFKAELSMDNERITIIDFKSPDENNISNNITFIYDKTTHDFIITSFIQNLIISWPNKQHIGSIFGMLSHRPGYLIAKSKACRYGRIVEAKGIMDIVKKYIVDDMFKQYKTDNGCTTDIDAECILYHHIEDCIAKDEKTFKCTSRLIEELKKITDNPYELRCVLEDYEGDISDSVYTAIEALGQAAMQLNLL